MKLQASIAAALLALSGTSFAAGEGQSSGSNTQPGSGSVSGSSSGFGESSVTGPGSEATENRPGAGGAPNSSGDSMGQSLSALDADGSGTISRSEAKGMPELQSQFKRLDSDRDGMLNSQELNQFAMQPSKSKQGSPQS